MKIIFKDGTEKECIQINADTRYLNGIRREVYEIHFNVDGNNFDDLASIFSDELKTQRMTLVLSDTESYIKENFTIQNSVSRHPIILEEETSTSPAITEERYVVTMAQKVYSEIQIQALQDTVDILVMESLEVI